MQYGKVDIDFDTTANGNNANTQNEKRDNQFLYNLGT